VCVCVCQEKQAQEEMGRECSRAREERSTPQHNEGCKRRCTFVPPSKGARPMRSNPYGANTSYYVLSLCTCIVIVSNYYILLLRTETKQCGERYMGLADRTCAHACDDIIISAAIKGRPPTQQDVQHNAGTPHISQLVIVSPQHLWCNIIRLRGAQPGGDKSVEEKGRMKRAISTSNHRVTPRWHLGRQSVHLPVFAPCQTSCTDACRAHKMWSSHSQ
jgi:hypothetical protein